MMSMAFISALSVNADRIAVTDPHGFILATVSVCVVFLVLAILAAVYTFTGKIFGGQSSASFTRIFRKRKTAGGRGVTDAEVAAVSLAVHLYLSENSEVDDEMAAAVAVALDAYFEDSSVHDYESGIITIRQ